MRASYIEPDGARATINPREEATAADISQYFKLLQSLFVSGGITGFIERHHSTATQTEVVDATTIITSNPELREIVDRAEILLGAQAYAQAYEYLSTFAQATDKHLGEVRNARQTSLLAAKIAQHTYSQYVALCKNLRKTAYISLTCPTNAKASG